MPEVGCQLYKLIEVHGEDASSFLQGQLTQDVAKLRISASVLSAWCNAKGRVIAVLRLLALPDAIGLVLPAEYADSVVSRLSQFRLRADVEFREPEKEWDCAAILDAESQYWPGDNQSETVDGLTVAGYGKDLRLTEFFGPKSEIRKSIGARSKILTQPHWSQALIRSGVTIVDEILSERFTAHMLNLDRLDAISFSKGCYTGQEIVARTENLGSAKRRIATYRFTGKSPAVGEPLLEAGRSAGEVVKVDGEYCLAMLAVTRIGKPLDYQGGQVVPIVSNVNH